MKGTGEPGWVVNPSVAGKVAGVGSCGYHIDGKSAQRSLAIKRAIDEIALQLGVTVENVTAIKTVGNRSGSTTGVQSFSLQTVNGELVKAVVKSSWKNPRTDELFVWMVTR